MSRHVSDTPYLGYELTVFEHSATYHSIDVKNEDGDTLYSRGGVKDDQDALMVGKAWVDGYRHRRRETATPATPAKPLPVQQPIPNGSTVVRLRDVLTEAASLVSDQGENEEYDRALAELCQRLLGVDPDGDAKDTIAAILQAL